MRRSEMQLEMVKIRWYARNVPVWLNIFFSLCEISQRLISCMCVFFSVFPCSCTCIARNLLISFYSFLCHCLSLTLFAMPTSWIDTQNYEFNGISPCVQLFTHFSVCTFRVFTSNYSQISYHLSQFKRFTWAHVWPRKCVWGKIRNFRLFSSLYSAFCFKIFTSIQIQVKFSSTDQICPSFYSDEIVLFLSNRFYLLVFVCGTK